MQTSYDYLRWYLSSWSYSSLAHDGGRPGYGLWGLVSDPGVYGEGKDVVEVVSDAGNQGRRADEDQDAPEDLPSLGLGQRDVVESVSGCPVAESWQTNR